jgi:O-antigen ligase
LAVLNALLGIYQHLVDGFRPFVTDLARFKTSYNVTEAGVLTSAAYAVGFFSHPNSYAIYLYLASMISLGWLSEPQRKYWKLLISGLLLTTLLYTYAKASLGVMFIAFLFFWSHRKSASPRRLILTVGLLVPGAIMLIWVLITYLPQPLLATFWWRVELWQIAIRTIWEAPWIPFVGNGMVLFAQNAFYPQPHNVYLYTLLQYGFPGLFILLLIGWVLFRQGMKAYSRGWFRQNPILGAAWAGLMGFFVIGLVESNLGGIELRSIFLILVASFTGLLRELHLNRSSRNVPRYTNSNNSSSETPYVETPNPFHL